MNWQAFWRQRNFLNVLLLPISTLFAAILRGRRRCYQRGLFRVYRARVPVIVVGNIVVGGGGKTPTVITLVQALQQQGWCPGVISRGYGRTDSTQQIVDDNSDWRQCGDEPLLIYQRTGVPVCVDRRRQDACWRLTTMGCDIIISDDGLQHYAMHRDIEIAVVKADYQFGNRWLLPAGPLREDVERLNRCHFITVIGDGFRPVNSFVIEMMYTGFYPLNNRQRHLSGDFFSGKKVAAIAGIAHPGAFFTALTKQGIALTHRYPLSDHRRLSDKKLRAIDAEAIIVTEKDAVKYVSNDGGCDNRLYAMAMVYTLPDEMRQRIIHYLHG